MTPFSVTTEVAACPWNPKHRLALIGLQARALDDRTTPARNLVFLLDVSGSMMPPDKLPLVKTALRMLADTLTRARSHRDRRLRRRERPRAAVDAAATSKERSIGAIDGLEAGGSTNGAAGHQARLRDGAQQQFIKGGINRVILATDGDFNVGVTSQGDLTRLIEEKRDAAASSCRSSASAPATSRTRRWRSWPIRGNGNYAYLDSLHEARQACSSTQAGATLVTVAKDVKIQVEFNPARRRLSPDRLREPAAAEGGLQRRQEGRRRDRRRALGDGALRDRARRRGDRSAGSRSAEYQRRTPATRGDGATN